MDQKISEYGHFSSSNYLNERLKELLVSTSKKVEIKYFQNILHNFAFQYSRKLLLTLAKSINLRAPSPYALFRLIEVPFKNNLVGKCTMNMANSENKVF